MGREEWAGIAIPLTAWLIVFTVLAIVTYRDNHHSP